MRHGGTKSARGFSVCHGQDEVLPVEHDCNVSFPYGSAARTQGTHVRAAFLHTKYATGYRVRMTEEARVNPTNTPRTGAGAPLLLVVSGPSGVGKTTITRAVADAFPDAMISVSLTTRPKGPNEAEAVDYRFVDEQEFQRRVDGAGPPGLGEFLEHAGVYGRRYGTLREPVERGLREGRLVILEIDVQGARQVRARYPSAFALFILPPGDNALLQRLRDRRRDPEDVIQKRFAAARREMADAREGDTYDAFVVNDDLPRAIGEAVQLVRERRAKAAAGAAR